MSSNGLEVRICKCGCGNRFKVFPTSKIRFSSKFCKTLHGVPNAGWKTVKEAQLKVESKRKRKKKSKKISFIPEQKEDFIMEDDYSDDESITKKDLSTDCDYD